MFRGSQSGNLSSEEDFMNDISRPIPAKEHAAWRGMSEQALAQERYRGAGPKFVKLGSRVYYRPEHIAEWLEANVHENTSPAA